MTDKKPGKTEAKPELEGDEIKGVEEIEDTDLDDAAGGFGLSRGLSVKTPVVNPGTFDTLFAGAADFNTVDVDLNFNTAGLGGLDKLER